MNEIEKAIILLKENGYVVKRLSEEQLEDAKKCENCDCECIECSCSICIAQ